MQRIQWTPPVQESSCRYSLSSQYFLFSVQICAQSGRSAVIRVTALDETDKPVAGCAG